MGKRHEETFYSKHIREQTHEKCSSLAITKTQIKILRCTHTPIRMATTKKEKRVKTSNGEKVQKLAVRM